ncbi:lantibiotic dehydratase [Bacillus sp. FJAT-22090]|uniref:lantibiotic dehydratase n=1 Tax=Bacillus sp. FJAT-22090 TaxID=1581038 RepID=UPI0011A02BD5|nr:lantibiotic dehydratase [Bacillus sp. FJAT-22090]
MTQQLISKNTFQPLNFFMVRSPLLSLNFYHNLFSDSSDNPLDYSKVVSNIKNFSTTSFIQEAILVSSGSLYNSIANWESITDPKRDKKIIHSLNRYLIRMSTRPTPFGLFSGISYGSFDNSTSFNIGNIKEHQKRTRPDMAWLLSIISKLETEPTVIEQLRIHKNSITYSSGSRYKNPYNSQGGRQTTVNSIESISINKNELIEFIFNLTEESIDTREIISLAIEKYPIASKDKILKLISQLIEKEYLLTNLRPPLTDKAPFLYLIDQLKKIKGKEELTEKIIKILQLITDYDNTKIGDGLNILKEINNEMNEIEKTKNLLQVDTRINTSTVKLNYKVSEEISKLAETLWKISPNSIGLKHIQQYRNEFIEKYGIYREVPVLELLDEDQGLGAPATYTNPMSSKELSGGNNSIFERKQNYLLNKLIEAINLNEIEICLNEKDLKELEYEDAEKKVAPNSMELYGNIIAKNQEDIDNGEFNFVMGTNSGSDSAGKTFGRFLDIIDNPIIEESFSTNNHDDDKVYAELVYLPTVGRSANVILTKNLCNYEVVIGTNSSKESKYTIPVSDIIVGSTLKRMYLKSKSLGKEIVITVNHMLNNRSAPNIYRFLSEISNDGIKQWSPFYWYSLEYSTFLPRIKVGKSIISPATWNINQQHISMYKGMKFTEWMQSFKKWSDKWNMPRWVYQTIGDNRILLDLENTLHLEDLYTQMGTLKMDENVTLFEKEDNSIISWIKDTDGNSYNVEYVFPLVRTYDLPSLNLDKHNNIIKPISSANNVVRKYPGGDWLYVKLYGSSSRENDLICYYLKNFCDEILEQNLVEKYFFMRYADPDKHIRLRLNGDSDMLYQKLLPLLHDFFKSLTNEGLLTNVSIATYDREVERYGGISLIDKAETLFYHDSRSVEGLLYLHRFSHTNLDLDIIATVSVLHYLKSFRLSFSEQLEWLDNTETRKEYLKEFREIKDTLIPLSLDLYEEPNLNIEGLREILKAINLRKDALEIYIDDVYIHDKENTLLNSLFDIFGSVIHMHLNRLLGVDREREKKVMTLARHTLYNSKYLRERKAITW